MDENKDIKIKTRRRKIRRVLAIIIFCVMGIEIIITMIQNPDSIIELLLALFLGGVGAYVVLNWKKLVRKEVDNTK